MPSNEIICLSCGKTFIRKPRSRPDTKFCSPTCAVKDWSKRSYGEYTGFCATCRIPVDKPHKFCSVACRNEASRKGKTFGKYTCAMCGKVVKRQMADAIRQKYCSHACAQRDRASDIVPPVVSPEFGHWLAGITDGEGCFSFEVNDRALTTRFVISLRGDDHAVIELIQRTLGFGKIYESNSSKRTNPLIKFVCNSVKECTVIANIFKEFPLRSKKAQDLAIWSEAINLMSNGEYKRDILKPFDERLRSARLFNSLRTGS